MRQQFFAFFLNFFFKKFVKTAFSFLSQEKRKILSFLCSFFLFFSSFIVNISALILPSFFFLGCFSTLSSFSSHFFCYFPCLHFSLFFFFGNFQLFLNVTLIFSFALFLHIFFRLFSVSFPFFFVFLNLSFS